jgi:hypothetical protein
LWRTLPASILQSAAADFACVDAVLTAESTRFQRPILRGFNGRIYAVSTAESTRFQRPILRGFNGRFYAVSTAESTPIELHDGG